MPMSKARKEANKRWNDANMKERYDRLQLVVLKGQKEIIKEAASACGESVNSFVGRLIFTEIERMTEAGLISINPALTEAESPQVDQHFSEREEENESEQNTAGGH